MERAIGGQDFDSVSNAQVLCIIDYGGETIYAVGIHPAFPGCLSPTWGKLFHPILLRYTLDTSNQESSTTRRVAFLSCSRRVSPFESWHLYHHLSYLATI